MVSKYASRGFTGKSHSKETLLRMKKSKMGKKHSLETRKKMSSAHSGENNYWYGKKRSEVDRKRIAGLRKGAKWSVAHRKMLSQKRMGSRSPSWKGGITPQNRAIRNQIDYRLWREAVFARDNWTCQVCFKRGCILNAHHIKPFAYFPELRFAIDNGLTLCVECHTKTDTYAGKALKKYA